MKNLQLQWELHFFWRIRCRKSRKDSTFLQIFRFLLFFSYRIKIFIPPRPSSSYRVSLARRGDDPFCITTRGGKVTELCGILRKLRETGGQEKGVYTVGNPLMQTANTTLPFDRNRDKNFSFRVFSLSFFHFSKATLRKRIFHLSSSSFLYGLDYEFHFFPILLILFQNDFSIFNSFRELDPKFHFFFNSTIQSIVFVASIRNFIFFLILIDFIEQLFFQFFLWPRFKIQFSKIQLNSFQNSIFQFSIHFFYGLDSKFHFVLKFNWFYSKTLVLFSQLNYFLV